MTKPYPKYRDPSHPGITYHSPGPGRIPCDDDTATSHQVPLTPRTDRRRAGREPGSASGEYNGPDQLAHKCTGDGKHTTNCRNVGCPNHCFNTGSLARVNPKKEAEDAKKAAKAAVARAEADLREADGTAVSAELQAEFGLAKELQEKGALTPGLASFAGSINLPL